jgi:hypothetical protein
VVTLPAELKNSGFTNNITVPSRISSGTKKRAPGALFVAGFHSSLFIESRPPLGVAAYLIFDSV